MQYVNPNAGYATLPTSLMGAIFGMCKFKQICGRDPVVGVMFCNAALDVVGSRVLQY